MIDYNDPEQVLTALALAEARGFGAVGMHGVLNTVGTRAAHPAWWGGPDLISVCLARGQFSCWTQERGYIENLPANEPLWPTALGLARQLIAGTLPDIVHGADSYYAATSKRPFWARPPAIYRGVIGGQVYYTVGATGLGTALGVIEPERGDAS